MNYYAFVTMKETSLQKPLKHVIRKTLGSEVLFLTELAGLELPEKNDQLVVITDKIEPGFRQGLMPFQQQTIIVLFIRQRPSEYLQQLATFPILHLVTQNDERIDVDQLLTVFKKNHIH